MAAPLIGVDPSIPTVVSGPMPAPTAIPDPRNGPVGYTAPPAYADSSPAIQRQAAFVQYMNDFDRVRRQAAEERRILAQSAQVDNQMKAIASAQQFIAQRRLASDIERGIPVGQALVQNFGAIASGDIPQVAGQLLRASEEKESVPGNEAVLVNNPATQLPMGANVRVGPKQWSFQSFGDYQNLSGSAQVRALESSIASIDREISQLVRQGQYDSKLRKSMEPELQRLKDVRNKYRREHDALIRGEGSPGQGSASPSLADEFKAFMEEMNRK